MRYDRGERGDALETKPGLNRNQLKYLVILAMLIDHIAWEYVPLLSWQGQAMHFFGRFTGPTMAFFLAEGYTHTRSVPGYALRLGAFALISWVPFSIFETGRWPTANFGVIYTLFLALLALWLWDKAPVPLWVRGIGVLALLYLSKYGDWYYFDVLWPLGLFLLRKQERDKWLIFWAVTLTALFYLLWLYYEDTGVWWSGVCNLGLVAAGLTLQFGYNGEGGSKHPFHKWFFYIFYPAHLIILILYSHFH